MWVKKIFTKYHDENYYCSYCELLVGSKEVAEIHERNVHRVKDHIIECHCLVCKK